MHIYAASAYSKFGSACAQLGEIGQAKVATADRAEKKGARPVTLSKLMALAIRYDQLIRAGHIKDRAGLSQLAEVSTARVTQLMNQLLLAPDIQEEILMLPATDAVVDPVSEPAPDCGGAKLGKTARPVEATFGGSVLIRSAGKKLQNIGTLHSLGQLTASRLLSLLALSTNRRASDRSHRYEWSWATIRIMPYLEMKASAARIQSSSSSSHIDTPCIAQD